MSDHNPTTSTETGWWDDNGYIAPWPKDIDDWSPWPPEPHTPEPGQPPF
jgi:hypothetical protein